MEPCRSVSVAACVEALIFANYDMKFILIYRPLCNLKHAKYVNPQKQVLLIDTFVLLLSFLSEIIIPFINNNRYHFYQLHKKFINRSIHKLSVSRETLMSDEFNNFRCSSIEIGDYFCDRTNRDCSWWSWQCCSGESIMHYRVYTEGSNNYKNKRFQGSIEAQNMLPK